MRWANEGAFDGQIRSAMSAAGLASSFFPIVKAIVAVESGFVPTAIRAEPSYRCPLDGKIGDASRGLMQILFCTARGMGFSGTEADLFDPMTNLALGASYYRDRLNALAFDPWAAVSAYNNGHGRKATTPTTVCLARGPGGICQLTFTARPGEFLNQPYVDKVADAARYFGLTDTGGAQPLPPVVIIGTPDPEVPSTAQLLAIVGAVLAGVLVLDALTS